MTDRSDPHHVGRFAAGVAAALAVFVLGVWKLVELVGALAALLPHN